jgi:isochorismate pyruvate lyase
MAEVRAGVDALDADLAKLLGQRFAYMRAAARIKPERHLVRDEARKAQVIANAQRAAREANWPEDIAAQLWEVLVEASIAYELAAFDARADQPAEAARGPSDNNRYRTSQYAFSVCSFLIPSSGTRISRAAPWSERYAGQHLPKDDRRSSAAAYGQ